jgi:hypothetical protein
VHTGPGWALQNIYSGPERRRLQLVSHWEVCKCYGLHGGNRLSAVSRRQDIGRNGVPVLCLHNGRVLQHDRDSIWTEQDCIFLEWRGLFPRNCALYRSMVVPACDLHIVIYIVFLCSFSLETVLVNSDAVAALVKKLLSKILLCEFWIRS